MKTRPPPWPHGVPLRRGSRQGAAHGPVDVTPARAARIGATSFSKSGLPRRSPSSRSSSSRRPRRRPRLRGPRDDGLARRLHVSEEATKEAAIEEQLRSWCRTRCARRPRGPAKVHVDHHNSVNVGRILAQCSSPQLRGYLLIHMSERWISNVAYFSEAPLSRSWARWRVQRHGLEHRGRVCGHRGPWTRWKNRFVGVPAGEYKDILLNTEVECAGVAARGGAARTDS